MNDADKRQLYNALGTVTNLTAHLSNLLGRAPRATKYWTDVLKKNGEWEAAKKANMKAAITLIAKLTKDAKVVSKDLENCAREAGDAKLLAKYPTGKAYRDQVVVKRLASAKAFDQNGAKFVSAMMSVLGSGLYPGMRDVDPKVTVDSIKNFSSYFNEMRIELAKL
ncbi:MAG TPA: hypothetical protein VE442_16295 [Jatrophihabitans sp.]|nr:hypothetical protein [Jatrophihabitans sp.]